MALRGSIADMEIANVFQLSMNGNRTGRLVLRHGASQGTVFFEEGVISHASFNGHENINALVEMLGWSEGDFEFHRDMRTDKPSAAMDVQWALMEATRLRDERRNAKADRDDDLGIHGREDGAQPNSQRKEAGTANMKNTLKQLEKVQGVHEVLIIGRDGFVIDMVGDMEAEEVGAVISTAIGAIEAMGRDCNQGELFEVMAEYQEGTIIAAPVGREAVLGVVSDKDANLGGIRHAVKKNLKDLARLL